jgi:hypothetical protein
MVPTMGLLKDFSAISHEIRRFNERIIRMRTTESTDYVVSHLGSREAGDKPDLRGVQQPE